jgi:deazaflavin-dependent oxidoreductase (nitroreductase family)
MLFGQEHVDRYLATDGAEGHLWQKGTTVLLLFTKGRKSGKERVHPLIYRDNGADFLIVASKGGAPEPPEWFKNIEADPNVQIQVKGDRFPVRARTATADEKPDLWRRMVEVWPDYDEYQKKTDREIPVVVLERT